MVKQTIIFALGLFALVAKVSGICDGDMVAVPMRKLAAEWNVGNVPHLFLNSEHLRGVASVRDIKIYGLDTVSTSLLFCPVDMTFYGGLTAARIHVTGSYSGNSDYIHNGTHLFGHGEGIINATVVNFNLTNLVAPLRYSRVMKKLQVEDMQYEATENVLNPQVTGLHVEGAGEPDHVASPDEIANIEKINSCPTLVEFIRAVINSKVKSRILLGAAVGMLESALPV